MRSLILDHHTDDQYYAQQEWRHTDYLQALAVYAAAAELESSRPDQWSWPRIVATTHHLVGQATLLALALWQAMGR